MVSLGTPEATLHMLIERLNWPVRMVRWRVAREYATLLSSGDHSQEALQVYLNWLSTREFESEIASALAVLLCMPENELPVFHAVSWHISKPSLLSDAMLQFSYGRSPANTHSRRGHSGKAPPSFIPSAFFLSHKTAHVPPVLEHSLEKLESRSGLPFMQQWTYEWHSLMQSTNSPYSGYPHYFIDSGFAQTGVTGQFSQRQCEVYRSAYLRTLAFAVDQWNFPANKASPWALDTLPINRGLAQLDPIDRPAWLSDIPRRCLEVAQPLETLVRDLVKPGINAQGMRPIALRIPVAEENMEFANLSISAILVSGDFAFNQHSKESPFARNLPWLLPDGISTEGPIEPIDIDTYISPGATGCAAPFSLNLWPLPSGFWHSDYFQVGVSIPAPYVLSEKSSLACRRGRIEILSGSKCAGTWTVWHDRWTPVYPRNGTTRCGTLTELLESEVRSTLDHYRMVLGWMVELDVWKQEKNHSEYKLTTRREFFLD